MEERRGGWSELWTLEDWWAVWFGSVLIALVLAGAVLSVPAFGRWAWNPLEALPAGLLLPLAALALGLGALTAAGAWGMTRLSPGRHLGGFLGLFALGAVAALFSQQAQAHAYGLEYPVWAVLLGLLISNTAGVPAWIRPAASSELYLKTGLVLLGAEILFSRVRELGPPGLFVGWLIPPIVLVVMYQFGVRTLRVPSRSFTIVIAAATAVCGVSAAIAAAGACRARREELTLAVAISIFFTILFMMAMPVAARALDMDPRVAGAWMGGTIDSTGAVVAAGAALGGEAETVAALVKMIQNVLIGIVAFAIAVYWVTIVDRGAREVRPDPMEIWRRFPKFILGFVLASLVFSFVLIPQMGMGRVNDLLKVTKELRGWLFCLAFVSIGLETDFRSLSRQMGGGKPIALYLAGQLFNVALTLLAAWLAFGGVLFEVPAASTR